METFATQDEPMRSLDESIAGGRLWVSPTPLEDRRLIVFVHGWRRSPRIFRKLLQALREDQSLKDCDLLPWSYRAGLFSNTDPTGVAQSLATEIDRLDHRFAYRSIFLVGHSMGGVIVRAALLEGIEREHEWALSENGKVRRIVLLASTNRGFQQGGFVRRLLIWLARHSPLPVSELGLNMLRGAPFVSGVRLRWLRHFQGSQPPETVQVRGIHDPIVGRDDSADLFRYDNSAEFPVDADHYSIVPLGREDPMYSYFIDALLRSMTGMYRPRRPAPRSRVVFLVHGIRDYGPWLDDLREAVLRFDPKAEVLPIRYGYFKLLDFLLPSLRAAKVRDFVDRYSQELAKRPDVPFAIAGHSNGTYIIGTAAKNVPGVVFERAYLAGSVLPDNFPWHDLIGNSVLQVRNDAARGDWVVALLCGTLSWLPFYRDLGIGGFAGFQSLPPDSESRYLQGGHGAALSKENLESVAEFLATGQPTALSGLSATLPSWLDRGSRGLFWILIAAAVAFILFVPAQIVLYTTAALALVVLLFLIAY